MVYEGNTLVQKTVTPKWLIRDVIDFGVMKTKNIS